MNLENAPTFVDAASAPAMANAAIAAALSDTVEKPVMADPPADEVELPCGIYIGNNGVPTTRAVVRELTGADEEAISRAANSPHPERLLTVLLKAGVVSLGGQAPTEDILDDLLVGDRDALVLGIRRATYGNDIEYDRYTCPHCGHSFALTITLDDIPVVKSDRPGKREITVELKNGSTARVRLMTGGDQAAMLAAESAGKTVAEQDTLLLSRTVLSIMSPSGDELLVAGNRTRVRDGMSMRDRGAILRALRDNRPGPRMDEVSITCTDCGQPNNVTVTVDALFRS